MFLEKIKQVFKIKTLRNAILFVLAMLLISRVAAYIPIPGIEISGLKEFFESNQVLGLLNMFSGGGMKSFSIVMLGVGPYITASIIMQLLTMIVPSLEALQKEGDAGRRKINQYTKYLTIPLALVQGYSLITLLQRQSQYGIIGHLSIAQYAVALITICAGTMFLMWLGELITEKKIGNGISLLIFAGIVERLPASLQQSIAVFDISQLTNWIILTILALITVAGVVWLTEGQRNIPVTYARRIRGHRMYGGSDTYLPMKVNQAGMIPIIFAISIVLFPSLIGQFMIRSSSAFFLKFGNFLIGLMQNQMSYGLTYFILVVAFTYFYTSIIFHPKQIAEQLQKQGGFIPGIRPGVPTSQYLANVSGRIMLAGALSLGLIAILPIITQNVFNISTFVIGGAAILIVVGVVLEVVKQIEAQISMHEYEGF